jgi:hypothetical protein
VDKVNGTSGMIEKMKNARKILVGKPEGKRIFERLRCTRQDTIKMGHNKTKQENVECLRMGLSGNEPSCPIK